MKKVEAIIREEKLVDVKDALERAGIPAFNITPVKGRGRQRGETYWRGTSTFPADILPKLKMDVVVKDEEAEKAIDAIMKAAWTGDVGDGKIFVSPMHEVVRIRTGERGDVAI